MHPKAFRQIYGKKHHELNRTRSHRVVRENISYGPHERNVLDVYLPAEGASPTSPASSTPPASPSSPASPASPKSPTSPVSPPPSPSSSSPSSPGYNRPVMIYVHGGGLVAGDKVWYKGSLYANIGDYFASHGIITVIINYRLVPDVTYPGGAEDIQRAREWVYHNISKAEFGEGDPEKVVLVGHSAGGLHLATNLYLYPPEPRPKPKPQKYPVQPESFKEISTSSHPPPPPPPPIAGIVFISTPFEFDSDTFSPMPPHNTQFQTALKAYYGTQHLDEVHELSPIGLMMEKIPDGSPLLDPRKLPCLVVLAQYDPQGIQDPTFAFVDEYRRRSPQGVLPEFVVVGGHNHISHVCSIGTEDDVQGRMLREFIGRVC
ncbi:Alpha/Beta hydrolase protein [Lentinula edodes]|nr:Alpha/Beta hydrolase protein [Lentinula edodes]